MAILSSAFLALATGAHAALELTPAETAWLQQHPVIRVGVDPEWPPFTYFDERGTLEGIDADFLHELGKSLGVRLDVAQTGAWEKTWEKFCAHELDLTTATALTEGRQDFADFTSAYVSFPVALVTRSDAPFLLGLRGLAGKTIAAPARHVTTERIQRDFPGIILLFTKSSVDSLRSVSEGSADAAVENLAIASHIIRSQGFTNLKVAGLTDYHFDLRFAVRKDWPELTSLLDRALMALPETEKNRILDRWIPLNYEEAINWQSVWRGVQWLFAFTFVILAVVFIWNRRLAAEIEHRRQVEEALRARETEIQRNNQTLRALNEEKDMLMHMAAHDLNNPLTSILLASETLAGDDAIPDPDARRRLLDIKHSARRMSRLIKNLLQIDAFEQDPSRLELEPVDISGCLAQAAERSRAVAAPKNITIGLEQQTVPPPTIRGNDDALDQIFDNLISNAVKYTPPGRSVAIRLVSKNDCARVEVRDQGPGIKKEDMPRMFGKFVRLSATPTGGESSTGLGLAIVKKLVQAMHGKVWCESEEGRGATFIVEFPLAG